MELNFVSDGQTSQEIGIANLRSCDAVIFLISPHYGSLLNECTIADCPVEDCPLKTGQGTISYTHCEYKVALAEKIPHQAYLVERGWDVVQELKAWRDFDLNRAWDNPIFDAYKNKRDYLKHLFDVAHQAWQFQEEARREYCPPISDIEDIDAITEHLATNIPTWYAEGRVNLKDFYGRKKDLGELLKKMEESVEVYGVGGVGKTTLIHVALLIQKLRGKRIVTVGTRQSYTSGSGYAYFMKKCRDDMHETLSKETISLSDIEDAVALPDEIRGAENFGKELGSEAKEKIKRMAEGHPVSTELLVRNYEKIDFDALKSYRTGLDLADPKDAEEFLKREIQEILSDEAFSLLQDLAALNTDLASNLDRAMVEKAYTLTDFTRIIDELLDTGMLKKRKGKEGIYLFSYHHLQEALQDEKKERYEKALGYYKNKIEKFGKEPDDFVELLFHQSYLQPDKALIDVFLQIKEVLSPVHYGFRRLIDVGDVLRNCSEFSDAEQAPISGTLANLYRDLRRFEDAEQAYDAALKIRKKLAEKNPDAYLSDLLQTQANIGSFYLATQKTEEEITALKNVLKRRDLLPDFGANVYANLGSAYEEVQKREEAAQSYLRASALNFILELISKPSIESSRMPN